LGTSQERGIFIMLRRIVLVGAGALALSIVIITPATVKAAVTGNVSCTLSGSIAVTPGLPLASPGPATKTVKTTYTFTGTLSNCTGTQSGTKKGAQIDGGTVFGVAKSKTAKGADLPSCLGLASPTTPIPLKTKVTFTHGGAKLTNSVATLSLGAVDLGPPVTVPIAGPVSGGAAFKGQNLTATAVLDGSATDLQPLCMGGASTTFTFSGVKGVSTLVTP